MEELDRIREAIKKMEQYMGKDTGFGYGGSMTREEARLITAIENVTPALDHLEAMLKPSEDAREFLHHYYEGLPMLTGVVERLAMAITARDAYIRAEALREAAERHRVYFDMNVDCVEGPYTIEGACAAITGSEAEGQNKESLREYLDRVDGEAIDRDYNSD